jgi:hypothetical protein
MDGNRVANELPTRFGGILLGNLIGANFNVTTDQQITIFDAPAKFILRRIVVTNASTSLTTAAGGVYTAVSKGGTAVVAAGQVFSSLTSSTLFLDLTLNTTGNANITVKSNIYNLYLSLTTAQGAAATADVYVFGDILTL